jgi:hypothetical protein
MYHIKNIVITLAICIFLVLAMSCKKKGQGTITYQNRVAQDPSYRMGKWYSIMPWTNQGANPNLDTIWFINDTLAGWSTFVPGNLYAYAYYKTYFPDLYHIAIIAPDPTVTGKIDTGINECGMTASGDTFAIFWRNGYMITKQQYVKKTN